MNTSSVYYALEKVANKDVTCDTPCSMFLYTLYVDVDVEYVEYV